MARNFAERGILEPNSTDVKATDSSILGTDRSATDTMLHLNAQESLSNSLPPFSDYISDGGMNAVPFDKFSSTVPILEYSDNQFALISHLYTIFSGH